MPLDVLVARINRRQRISFVKGSYSIWGNFIRSLLVLFISVWSFYVEASPTSIQTAMQDAERLYHTGNILAANDLLKSELLASGDEKNSLEYRYALTLLIEICDSVVDEACLFTNIEAFLNLALPNADSEWIKRENTYYQLILARLVSRAPAQFDYPDLTPWLEQAEIGHSTALMDDPLSYVRINVAQADVFLNLNLRKGAKHTLDRALAGLLSMNAPAPVYFANQLVRILELMVRSGQPYRASRIFTVARSFLKSTLHSSLPRRIRVDILEAQIAFLDGTAKNALDAYKSVLDNAMSLQIEPYIKQWYVDQILIDVTVLCIATDDIDGAQSAIRQHSLASKQVLGSGERFSDHRAYLFASAMLTVAVMSGEDYELSWVDALLNDPISSGSIQDPNVLRSYGLFARGMALSQNQPTKGKAKIEFARAAVLRLKSMAEEWNSVGEDYYVPNVFDRLVLQAGLSAIASDEKLTKQYADEALLLAQLNNRSIRDMDGDALWELAHASTPDEKRLIHSRKRILSRLRRLELDSLIDSIEQISSQMALDSSTQPLLDFEKFQAIAGYGTAERKVNTALLQAGDRAVPEDANLSLLQNTLGSEEAFISITPVLDRFVYMCVRKDRFVLRQSLRDDSKFSKSYAEVIAALTRSGPPSITEDLDYPVKSAAHLYEALLSPINDCLDGIEHLVWSPPSFLLTFPIGALIRDLPPDASTYIDLSKLDWFARHYAFSYTSSARGFLAARSIGLSLNPDRTLFGIGDPVLDGTINGRSTGGAFLAEHTERTRGGTLTNLWELPETGRELQSLARIDGPGYKLLTRESATEVNFRNQRLARFQTLAFATHGLIRRDHSNLRESALVLTPVDAKSSWNDGLLTSSEIADLNLQARLVLLSACNTANFEMDLWATEIPGLTTAFANAGAPTLLVTLWPVESRTAEQLVTKFYKSLKDAPAVSRPSASLRSAIVEFLGAPPSQAHSHPRHWSQFVIYGDGWIDWDSDLGTRVKPHSSDDFIGDFVAGGNFLDARYVDETDSIYISGFGDLSNGRYQGLVAKVTGEGQTQWLDQNPVGASTRIVKADPHGVTVAGFLIENGQIVTQIRRISSQGKEEWTTLVRANDGRGGYFIGAYDVSENLVSVVVLTRAEWGKSTKQQLITVQIDQFGKEVSRSNMEIPLETQWRTAFVRQFGQDVYVVVNSEKEISESLYLDSYKLVHNCAVAPRSLLIHLDAASGREHSRQSYVDISLNDLELLESGVLVSAGAVHSQCGTKSQAVLARLSGVSADLLYTDTNGVDSSGYELTIDNKNELTLFGGSTHRYGVRPSQKIDDPISIRDSAVTAETRDGFQATVDTSNWKVVKTWIPGGSSMSVSSVISIDGRHFLVGSSGIQPMWTFVD